MNDNNPYEVPGVPLTLATATDPSWWVQLVRVFGRGLAYGLAIWLVFGVVYRPLFVTRTSTTDSAQTAREQAQQTDLMTQYQEQARKTDELLAESERQQQRMGVVIARQEDQAERMDEVIRAWEREAGVGRPGRVRH